MDNSHFLCTAYKVQPRCVVCVALQNCNSKNKENGVLHCLAFVTCGREGLTLVEVAQQSHYTFVSLALMSTFYTVLEVQWECELETHQRNMVFPIPGN